MNAKRIGIAAVCGVLALGSSALADQIQLTGIIRDFKRGDQSGGHPDFETAGSMGRFGHVLNLVAMDLSSSGKPVYNPTRPSKDTMQSATKFDQWFNDVIGVNAASPLTITLDNEQSGPGGVYTYQNNAFWPINGLMFGNQGLSKNFHFTYEIKTKFTYTPGQTFTFIGDDDVWVYVNGKRCIDVGGVHSAVTANFFLFDGKAFVTKAHFVLGGDVLSVSSTMAADMATKWQDLSMPGNCPIVAGDRYINLNLNGGHGDTRANFTNSDKTVTVYAAAALVSARLTYLDGFTEEFTLGGGHNATLAGTGIHQNKKIVNVLIKSGTNTDGQTHSYNGATQINCDLAFFFAERHTTQSNFRIDTSINLNTVQPTVISPLYD
ncbi:MAG: fibro-slime domain-containing protein [Phycisphaeraceae bacterium]